MGATRALFCDEEGCNRLGAEYYVGHWLRFPDLDLDFCSVECALDFAHGGLGHPSDFTVLSEAVKARAAINPEASAAVTAWWNDHERLWPCDHIPAAPVEAAPEEVNP